jgi:hypothetical protein
VGITAGSRKVTGRKRHVTRDDVNNNNNNNNNRELESTTGLSPSTTFAKFKTRPANYVQRNIEAGS